MEKGHAQRRREAKERRTRVLFQPVLLGNYWYIVKWPSGEILPTGGVESREEVAALIATYKAA